MEPFAWPLAVVIVAVVFMLLFRDPISSLLGRTKKVGKAGLETHDHSQLPAETSKPDRALEEFMAAYDNPLLLEQEEVVRQDLIERGLTGEDGERALVRSLAGTHILLAFERMQTSIFASQIDLLTHLNGLESGTTTARAREFFDSAVESYPELYEGREFADWLDYLSSWTLVAVEDDRIAITRAGREFLKWRLGEGRYGPTFG